MPLLDDTRDDDAHIGRRLAQEPIIWLGTTRPDGRPHNVPVWFLWDDPVVLIFAPPTSRKVHHLRTNAAVALALDSAQHGTDIVRAEGHASLMAEGSPSAAEVPAFVAKYRPLLAPPATFTGWAATFSQPIRITTTRIHAWTHSPQGHRQRVITLSDEG
jgi:PPOX class probable F420-dependent enzyme